MNIYDKNNWYIDIIGTSQTETDTYTGTL